MSVSDAIRLPEVVVFAGPNGSGKTTITRMMSCSKSLVMEYISTFVD